MVKKIIFFSIDVMYIFFDYVIEVSVNSLFFLI